VNAPDKEDKRFLVAKREAIIGIVLVIINFAWWYGFAYGLGSKPVSGYSYIWGLPSWFFYSCVLGFILMVVLVFIVVKMFFKEVPFDEEGES